MTVRRKSKPGKTRASAGGLAGAFDDASAPPVERELSTALGAADSLWRLFLREVRVSCDPLVDEWSFSKAFGWTLRLKQPGRILVYLTPGQSHYLASFALGDKTCTAVREAGIPAAIQAIIDAAPKYAEGRGVRIPVRTKSDLKGVLDIAAIKASTTRKRHVVT